jgi:hypothetical protein
MLKTNHSLVPLFLIASPQERHEALTVYLSYRGKERAFRGGQVHVAVTTPKGKANIEVAITPGDHVSIDMARVTWRDADLFWGPPPIDGFLSVHLAANDTLHIMQENKIV